MAVPMALTRV